MRSAFALRTKQYIFENNYWALAKANLTANATNAAPTPPPDNALIFLRERKAPANLVPA
jgi:hypothetical protein